MLRAISLFPGPGIRRNTKAARRFLAKALKVMRNWPPASITTDKLGSYPKALRRLKRTGELKVDEDRLANGFEVMRAGGPPPRRHLAIAGP